MGETTCGGCHRRGVAAGLDELGGVSDRRHVLVQTERQLLGCISVFVSPPAATLEYSWCHWLTTLRPCRTCVLAVLSTRWFNSLVRETTSHEGFSHSDLWRLARKDSQDVTPHLTASSHLGVLRVSLDPYARTPPARTCVLGVHRGVKGGNTSRPAGEGW